MGMSVDVTAFDKSVDDSFNNRGLAVLFAMSNSDAEWAKLDGADRRIDFEIRDGGHREKRRLVTAISRSPASANCA